MSSIVLISFWTKELLDRKNFELFLAETFRSHDFFWTTDFYFYVMNNQIDQSKTYVSLDTSNEGYKYNYTVLDWNPLEISLENQTTILRELSVKENIEILSSDGELDPRTCLLIESNGQISNVQLKLVDDVIIDDYFNLPFGDLRTTEPLTDKEKTILKNIVKSVYPDFLIESWTDGPIINGAFNKVKGNYQSLKNFDHHYTITPIGKNEWMDREEKSVRFVLLMKEFQVQIQKDLCVFPCNFFEIKSIGGGTDSDEHCIVLTAFGEEKTIYKVARKSWADAT